MEHKKIEWADSYSVGNADMDRQHQHILQLINEIVELLSDEDGTTEVMSRLMRLYEVAQQHFYFEEILLSRSDYSDLKGQQGSHSQYTDRVLEMMSEGITNAENQNALVAFLLEWWNHHILVEDMAYKGAV